jgi:hypothetical protein
MQNQKSQVHLLTAKLEELKSELSDIKSHKIAEAHSLFAQSGGCETCRGRGWVVTWDTLDCVQGSYAQYGSCPNEECNRESRQVSGLSPANRKHDRFNASSTWFPSYTDEESSKLEGIAKEIAGLKREITLEENRWTVSENKIVKVFSVGKGPIKYRPQLGLSGVVVKTYTNSWGVSKTCLLARDGAEHWVKTKLVEVIDPDPDLSKWKTVLETHRERNGIPLIAVVKRKTQKAALIKLTTGQEFWQPFSQSPDLKSTKTGEAASFTMPLWMAKKKGITK